MFVRPRRYRVDGDSTNNDSSWPVARPECSSVVIIVVPVAGPFSWCYSHAETEISGALCEYI